MKTMVLVIESQKDKKEEIDERKYFKNEPEAEAFVALYNSRVNWNNLPDVFTYAKIAE